MLYIRHAQKAYSNGNSELYPLDPSLTDKGRFDAKIRFRYLLKKFGVPYKIITSPYLRTRETAQIARDLILNEYNISIEIIYEPLIGEYLGHQKVIKEEFLRPETLILKPILLKESWNEFIDRIKNFINFSTDGWYITHGVVIKTLLFLKGIDIKYIGELKGIYVKDNDITLI